MRGNPASGCGAGTGHQRGTGRNFDALSEKTASLRMMPVRRSTRMTSYNEGERTDVTNATYLEEWTPRMMKENA